MSSTKAISPRQYLDNRISDMESEQSSWTSHWQDLVRNFSPRRGKFTETDRNKGNRLNFLSNNTPLFARRVLTSGMMTGITSPARPWFRIDPPDPEMAEFGPVREWLDVVERLIYRVFAASNLYRVLPNLYEDTGVIGTSAMIQEEDFNTVTRFTPFTTGEYMLDINGELRVDTFARQYEMTVYQIVQKFVVQENGDMDWNRVSQTVHNLWDNNSYSSWVPTAHVIEPTSLQEFGAFDLPEEMKWRSVYYEPGRSDLQNDENDFLRVKGYRDFPILAPRWDAKAGDTYGYSPGMDALGDARALQVQEREKGKAVAKMVAPPTMAPTALKSSNLSLIPGAANFTDDTSNGFRAIYQIDPKVYELRQDIAATEDRINRAFYVDLFLLISQQDDVRTATEIAARQEEKLLQLGPILEGLNDELLDPLIDRTFAMLIELSKPGWRGEGPMLLPPPPEELQDSDLKIEYISVLQQAQKLVSTGAMERWIGFTGQVAAFKPEVLDKVNGDKAVENMAVDLGVPANVVVSDADVAEQREVRAKTQQQVGAQAQMGALVDNAKTLSETPTTGGNVLNDIVGVGEQ